MVEENGLKSGIEQVGVSINKPISLKIAEAFAKSANHAKLIHELLNAFLSFT